MFTSGLVLLFALSPSRALWVMLASIGLAMALALGLVMLIVRDMVNPVRALEERSDEMARGEMEYNYAKTRFPAEEAPGISVFCRDEAGNIFHTYSCFARGLDMMNAAYHYLDLTPLGRHEEGLPYPMDWVRLRDQYQPGSGAAACCQT